MLFFLALFSCLHSAMRTIITPFLYGLAAAQLAPPKKKIIEKGTGKEHMMLTE
jgi:hypothetical protein